MSANDTIFALALASNLSQQQHFSLAYQQIGSWGKVNFSNVYQIPCRDDVGDDYWNAACLLITNLSSSEVESRLKWLETLSGRLRPSHQISLDVDLIAWGNTLTNMQWNRKKLPLAVDVKIPLSELWQHVDLQVSGFQFPKINFNVDLA
ncbi:2-amino-4-hydroxy-6-hydroxymethyldihydropteridine diphosphokinase [Acinetobacter sp. MD2]|uniref:2-amino-4-hydroxy-6- hydroxymethyldihydropteridine diphosphokinase n=1 Tax=Acinetobacter sp. MD2 TaxID=2600066 RepID=UPI002D1E8A63|nr:2-amino-4-hydroxy-6-hydroxymethyldihydropteridine diphosphokinase [Acinetobacter sp. MD2]MEB3767836.1 2-amino-4-hydroxy-6-hydroxymethyldihydropteridine diphosphokinase [Acinetobacter sp. MD2]